MPAQRERGLSTNLLMTSGSLMLLRSLPGFRPWGWSGVQTGKSPFLGSLANGPGPLTEAGNDYADK